MKRLFFSLLIGCLLSFAAPAQAADLQEQIEHELIEVNLRAGTEQSVPLPFAIQALAIDEVEGVEFSLRQSHGWTPWTAFTYEEPGMTGSDLRFIPESSAVKLRADRSLPVELTVMRVAWADVQVAAQGDLPVTQSDSSLQVAQNSSFQVIPRRDWGADEALGTYIPSEDDDDGGSGTNSCAPIEQAYPGQFQLQSRVEYFDSLGRNLIWPRRYSKQVKKIVVHHTAKKLEDLTGDGRINSRDYRLAVQAIYTYHTVSRGWGDIGYHYLVDPDGKVYEGRAGGASVIGAHVLCQNSNTIGVSVMGNFEEERVAQGSFEGLVNIVTQLSQKYNVNPEGKSSFRGTVIPHIVTHADVGQVTKGFIGRGATQCPGQRLKLMMARVRETVADGGIAPDYAYELISQPKRLKVNPLESFTADLIIKNTGQLSWREVQVLNPRGKKVLLSSDRFVSPGQELILKVPLEAPLDAGREQQRFQIVLDETPMRTIINAYYTVARPNYRYEVSSIEGHEDPLLVGEKRKLTLTLKNTSNFPWRAQGSHQVMLREVTYKGTRPVMVVRGITIPLPDDVGIDEEITIETTLPVQLDEGDFSLNLLPMMGRTKGFKGRKVAMKVPVEEPRFDLAFNPIKRSTRLRKGFEQDVEFEIKNTSNFVWEPRMVSYALPDGQELVIDSALKPGDTISFPITVRSGYTDKTVQVPLQARLEHWPRFEESFTRKGPRITLESTLKTRGSVRLRAKVVRQSLDLIPNEEGDYTVTVDVMNRGTVPWYRDGQDRMVLKVKNKPDFLHPSWEKRKIAGFLVDEVVRPGETGRFTLDLRVRSTFKRTTYDDFELVAGEKTIKDTKIRFGTKGRLKARKERATDESTPDSTSSNDSTTSASVPAGPSIPPMRVWLTDVDQDTIEISSPGSFIVWDSASVQVRPFSSGEIFRVTKAEVADGTIFRVRAKEADYLEFQNWDRIRAFGDNINDNTFRDVLEFRLDEGRLIAINELSLEDYMKGIAEVPETDDQPTDKRKVIAVLARSYALHYLISDYQKFPGKPYNAADSPAIFQKYIGYNFELRSPKWQQVLQDTRREVVVLTLEEELKDAVLRAAYFSCTDGDRTKSWDEVWPTNEYFQRYGGAFQTVQDPLGDDPSREGFQACGHQVGLSGYGATQMAQEGESYRDIIQYYYRGVSIDQY